MLHNQPPVSKVQFAITTQKDGVISTNDASICRAIPHHQLTLMRYNHRKTTTINKYIIALNNDLNPTEFNEIHLQKRNQKMWMSFAET